MGYYKGLPEGSSKALRGGTEIPKRTKASKAKVRPLNYFAAGGENVSSSSEFY